MKKRTLVRLGLALAVLVGVLLLAAMIAWWWLTATRSGAEFLLGQAQSRTERLEWSRAEGSLSDGLVLDDLEFAQAGLEVSAGRIDLAVGLTPFPPFDVQIERLALTDVTVTLPPADPDAQAEPFRPGNYALPIPVGVDRLRLDGLTVNDADGAELLRIERAALSGSAFAALHLERLEVESPQGTLRLQGRAGLAEPWTMDLDAELRPVLDDLDLAADVALDGPLDRLSIGADLRGAVRGQLEAELRGLPDPGALSGRLDWTGAIVNWPGLDGRIDEMEIHIEGRAGDWQADAESRVALARAPETDVSLEARGGADAIEQATLVARLLDGELRATGQANWAEAPTGSATIELSGLDFTSLYPEWPSQARLAGTVEARVTPEAVVVEGFALQAPPAELRVDGQGRYRFEDRHASVALDWTELVWPPVLDDSEPLFSSAAGRFEGRGTLEEWQAELGAWLQLPDQPRTRVEIDAEGDRTQARIERGMIRPDDAGQLRFSGRAGLGEVPTADLDLALERFDPGVFVPQLPGRVDGQARLDLAGEDLALEIRSLGGQIRGQPLAGDGELRIAGTRVERASVELALGENRAVIDRPGPTAWTVSIDADRLDQVWPTLAGELTADTVVRTDERRLEWELASPGVIVGARRAGALQSRGVVEWGEQPSATARITAEDIDLNPWERLDRVELTLVGDCRQHRLNAYASGTRATLDLAAGGMLADCANPAEAWQGQIDRLVIAETPLGLWRLDRPLEIAYGADRITAGPACLWTTGHDGRLCLNELDAAVGPSASEGRAAVAFNAVPTDLVLLPLDPAFSIGTELRGLARVAWDGAGLTGVDGRLLMDSGPVQLLGTDGELLTIEGADLALASPEPRSVQADLDLRLEGASTIVGRVAIPNVNDPSTTSIDGRLSLNLPRLSAFNRLVPQLDRLQGRLDAELTVAGPLLAPEFDGEARLREGRIVHAPYGMDLTAIDLTLDADQTGGRLTGAFQAGDGRARIDGRMARETGAWRGRVAVDGEGLQLFDAEWLRMTISPDLAARFEADGLELDGTLVVDSALLGLPPGSESRIQPSDDVVIVGAEPEDEDAAAETAPIRPIVGTVGLRLGDDVRMEAAGMTTRLAGELDITWNGDGMMPTADGRIQLVDGAYRSYGQNLEVRSGDVIFSNRPIDNPRLDIEAVREIFGDPSVEYAGVQIRGPAQDPEIELFTTPPSSRAKALAYVLTGAEFDHAAGQGAFNVGFWVLPRLFVSYGLGLFDTGNVLAARFELSRRWGLRATSGESDTGADVSFMIDR
ncbi:translocation/assembly module TamB domain-containing protein [Halomonas denitrificans]|nr:translocation/assembly module TamB domain-containing protein [Halomonas denitrificans]